MDRTVVLKSERVDELTKWYEENHWADDDSGFSFGIAMGIRHALHILGIPVKGIVDESEVSTNEHE